uniref:Uncharacterized protein n=1 Tax=Setaria digitata TaxID=48799 RepID=A0A915Q4Z0_9BILA
MLKESSRSETINVRRNGNLSNELNSSISNIGSGSILSDNLLNRNFDSDVLEEFDPPNPEFEDLINAGESVAFNEVLHRMKHEVDELENEDWIRGDISSVNLSKNIHFGSPADNSFDHLKFYDERKEKDSVAPRDLTGSFQQAEGILCKAVFHNCQKLHHLFLVVDKYHPGVYHSRRLSAGSSGPRSPHFIRRNCITGYRQCSYPDQGVNYAEMDTAMSDPEMDNLASRAVFNMELTISMNLRHQMQHWIPEYRHRKGTKTIVSLKMVVDSEDIMEVIAVYFPKKSNSLSGHHRRFVVLSATTAQDHVACHLELQWQRSLLPVSPKRISFGGHSTSSESGEERMEEVSLSIRRSRERYPRRKRRSIRQRDSRRHLSRSRNS